MTEENQDLIIEKYQPKKINNKKMLGLIMDKLTASGIERFKDCSTYNEFIATADKKHKKNIRSNACGKRFCPVCEWKKARKNGLELATLIKAIEEEKNQEFLFLTLTTPNVKGHELINEINRFNKAFNKLFKRKKVIKAIKGYARKLEVTYNKERDDYNPHFHVILSVNKSYFTSRDYIPQKEWLEMWRDCTGLTGVTENGTDEITQLHIKKVRKGHGKNSQGSAISEVAKYSAKDMEMSLNKEVFDTFYQALSGRQLLTYNGFFKEYKKLYKEHKLDKYIDKDMNDYVLKIVVKWNDELMKYDETYGDLSDEEKKEFNYQLLQDIEVE